MDRYPSIAEQGLVGDLQTAALVSSQGVVDWFAAPRFDSPSAFAALLDHDRGGCLRLSPEHPEGTCRQLYYPDTGILVTRFMSPDGLRGSEGTFSLCTFLYVDALARAGRLPQARYTFEKMQTYANHVGLFAEEIGPTGEQLGNFPQAFRHPPLIMAALTLDEALDAAAQGS